VTDHDGKPVSDATVKLTLDMPAMPEMGMAAMKVSPVLAWNGADYSGKANIPSAGSWDVTIKVIRQNQVIASKKIKLMAK
jgi:NO-binding membrane sensor protein with MHYT domain